MNINNTLANTAVSTLVSDVYSASSNIDMSMYSGTPITKSSLLLLSETQKQNIAKGTDNTKIPLVTVSSYASIISNINNKIVFRFRDLDRQSVLASGTVSWFLLRLPSASLTSMYISGSVGTALLDDIRINSANLSQGKYVIMDNLTLSLNTLY